MGIMEKRRPVMVMMFVMVVMQRCHGWGGAEKAEDMVRVEAENAKNAAEKAKKMASEAVHDAKDKTASWTGWVSDKISM